MHLYNAVPDGSGVEGKVTIQQHLLWDRKAEGGFPGMFTSYLLSHFIHELSGLDECPQPSSEEQHIRVEYMQVKCTFHSSLFRPPFTLNILLLHQRLPQTLF